ncbi:MAG: Gfo/Idh/MocA family oxidoreductase [Candidatus Saliniplasma sp.]
MRVGVVGVGAMGQHHARVYSELSDDFGLELVGIADKDLERAQELSDEYSYAAAYDDHKELAEEGLDAVTIAVPTSLHKDIALDFIEKGTDILIEKPIADTVENAREILDAAGDNGVTIGVGHIERYNPAVQKLKKVIDDGVLGEVMSINGTRVGPLAIRVRDVGIIIDLAVHEMDVISYLLDEMIQSVTAKAGNAKHPADVEDYAQIMVDFDNGKTGVVETNWLTPHKTRKLTVVGTKGIAYLDYIDQSLVLHTNDWEQSYKIEEREPLKNEIEDFLSSCRNGGEPCVTGEDGLHVLEAAQCAKESSQKNKKVKVA